MHCTKFMQRNPFETDLSRLHSNYCLAVQRDLKYSPGSPEITRLTLEVFDELQRTVLDESFTCTGAQAAFRQEMYRLGVYPELASPKATAGLARDLFTFVEEQKRGSTRFATFIAAFAGPRDLGEEEFESQLWEQLNRLHDLDRAHHRWDPRTSSDPDDPCFSYSFAGSACFVVGMHAGSSRVSRRFPYSMLVFNLHDQFERLRNSGAYEQMKAVIRQREMALQGSINPMLDDFGGSSEARQYSGRAVGPEWRCPFQARNGENGS